MSADASSSPPAEVDVTPELVRALLRDQHADLADLPIAEALLKNEQAWLPRLAPSLPLPIPAPLRTGVPGAGYPFVWSILP